ncbi:glycosyltransferase family 2 protein [Poseidonocella pacifica]|uniref:glycosyltransferase family 2 protein n=1 Tax=Poseidonocella pacifica TaxID=871651 RepID=UPI001FE0C539|nr:glycosyltransferase family 2 protein [Poseidonocella pacifica]
MTVSVVVASRGRPELLPRCLMGVAQSFHPRFEIVLVADPPGLAAARQLPFFGAIKTIGFDTPNLSRARNRGIAAASGEIIAFIDDDAVPEPTWLDRLCAPFDDETVAATTGFVRGRNGISFQWRGETVDFTGQAKCLPVARTQIFPPNPDRIVKLHGVNMAVRRNWLAALGGFDPSFAFYHDDADLGLRIAVAGGHVAVVPDAQVHHGFARSVRRRSDRVPLDLLPIGQSEAIFLRKHAPKAVRAPMLAAQAAAQRRRLLRHMQGGTLDASEVVRLLAGHTEGQEEGLRATLPPTEPLGERQEDFRRFPALFGPPVFLAGPWRHRKALMMEARQRTRRGERVSLLILSRTALYHKVSFVQEGFWLQRGGVWGRARRAQQLIQKTGFAERIGRERRRIALLRGLRSQ